MNQVTVHSHYLPAEAIQLIGRVCVLHPVTASAVIVASFVLVLWFFRRQFGRGGGDIFVMALFLFALVIFSAACLYVFVTHPGYRVFHPGF